MAKQTRLSVYVRLTMKDLPSGHRGLYSESFVVGGDEPASLSDTVLFLLSKILAWYCTYTDTDILNQELDKIRTALAHATVEEVENAPVS